MKKSLIFSGSGGQGVVSAGVMTAKAAVESGKYATFLPEYGPEQRGGSAKCTVVISDAEIISPLAKKCDILVCMNEQSFAKFNGQLKEGGILLINSNRVTSPVKREDITAISLPVDDIAVEVGNPRAANIVIIGALIGVSGIVSEAEFLDSLKKKFASKPQALEMNAVALKKGIEIGKQFG